MAREIFHKEWNLGRITSTESSTLLNMMETIHRKLKHINSRSVKIYQDNKLLINSINNELEKESLFIIETSVEITRIK